MRHGNAEVTQDQWVAELRPSVFRAIGRQRKRAQGDAELVALLNLLEEFMGYVIIAEPMNHEDVIQRRIAREQAWLLKSE